MALLFCFNKFFSFIIFNLANFAKTIFKIVIAELNQVIFTLVHFDSINYLNFAQVYLTLYCTFCFFKKHNFQKKFFSQSSC
jgi:hypothetical protein